MTAFLALLYHHNLFKIKVMHESKYGWCVNRNLQLMADISLFGQGSHEKIHFTLVLLQFKGYAPFSLPLPPTIIATQLPY